MIVFMGFIVTLVVMMIKPHKADSLIDADYYEKGQVFDRDYDAKRAALDDQMSPTIQAGAKGVNIVFPKPVTYTILIRNLADSNFDKAFKSDSVKTEVVIPANELKSGSWLLRIEYKSGTKEYLYQDKMLLP